MNRVTTKAANAAYLRITGRTSPLKRSPRGDGTLAWQDHQGKRFVALWGIGRQLIGWRHDGVSHWLPGHEPTTPV